MNKTRKEMYDRLESQVGNTPLIELDVHAFSTGSRLFAKAEHTNPTGSHYDRVYLHLLRKDEEAGVIVSIFLSRDAVK